MEKLPYRKPKIESNTIVPELKGRGVFFDTHEIMKADGRISEYVYKDFHLDILFDRAAAVDLFSKQEEEYALACNYFPKDMIAQSIFLIPEDMKGEYADAKFGSERIYDYSTFLKIQLNRRMGGRFGLDERFADREKQLLNRGLRFLGTLIEKNKEPSKPFGVLQERVHGISFGGLFKQRDWQHSAHYETLRENVATLLSGLRTMHEREERIAYTWHSLDSDNIMVETDEAGDITGRVVILDTNFLQRPDEMFKEKVVKTLEKKILAPLAAEFALK